MVMTVRLDEIALIELRVLDSEFDMTVFLIVLGCVGNKEYSFT